jgi:hypothetical protein
MKIIALEESVDFATLDTEKLFSKLKSHELSHKGRPNHDASLSSKALITSACVGGHDANPTTTISSALEFALSSLLAASDEQYESILDDEIALLERKFRALQGAASSAATPPTSSPTAPRERSSTPPTSTTTPTRTTPTTWQTTRRSTASDTRRRRRSSRRSYPEHVLSWATLTSPVMTPLA